MGGGNTQNLGGVGRGVIFCTFLVVVLLLMFVRQRSPAVDKSAAALVRVHEHLIIS